MNVASGETHANAPESAGDLIWGAIVETALNGGARYWFLVAAILAATMCMWPPHIYI